MSVLFNATAERITLPSAVGLLDQSIGGVLVVFKVPASAASKFLFSHYAAFNIVVQLFIKSSGDATAPGQLEATWRTPAGLETLLSTTRVDDDVVRWAYLRRDGNTFELYVGSTVSNGALEDSAVNAAVGTDGTAPTVWIGNNVEADTEPVNGEIARHAIWRGEAPTLAQIQTFLDTGVPPGDPSWYELFEGGADWSGNGQHGVATGTPTPATHPSFLGFTGEPWSSSASLVDEHGRLAVSGTGKVYIVGHDGTDLVCRTSNDDGVTWGANVVIAAGGAGTNYPMQYGGLYAEGDVVHLLTAATHMGPDNAHLDYRRSTDAGATWTAPVRITLAGEEQRRANIAAANGRIFVFGGRVNTAQLYEGAYVFRSTDDGATWSATIVDSAANQAAGFWGMVDGDTVYYATARKFDGPPVYHKTYYVRSTDGGLNYSAPVALGVATAGVEEARQRIAKSGTTLLCVWEGQSAIKGVRSTDDGVTWGSVVTFLAPAGVELLNHEELATRPGGWFHLVAMTRAVDDIDVAMLYIESRDGGVTWSAPTQVALDRSGETNQLQSFAVSADRAHINTSPDTANLYANRVLTSLAIKFDKHTIGFAIDSTISVPHNPVVESPAGVLVAVELAVGSDLVTSVAAKGVPLTRIAGGEAIKATGEPMSVFLYFLGSGVPSGNWNVVVNLSESAFVLVHVVTVSALSDVEVVDVDTINSDAVANPSVTLQVGGRTSFSLVAFVSGQDAPSGTTPLANWTDRGEGNPFGTVVTGLYTKDVVDNADVTAGWTQTAEDVVAIAVALAVVLTSQGPFFPGTVATVQEADDDNDWVNPGNVAADDGVEAQVTAATFDANDQTFALRCSNFGFTIPADATIDGVMVEVEQRQFAGAARDHQVQLFSTPGAVIGDDKATATVWPATATIAIYGGVADDWNASLTPAIINAVGFGVQVKAFATAANTDIGIDFVRVTVAYTESASGALIVANAVISLSIDSPELTQANVLVVQDALIALSAESLVLEQANTLAVQDAVVALAIESLALIQANLLIVQDAQILFTVESPALTQAHLLAIQDVLLALAIDQIVLNQSNQLTLADAMIALAIESPVLMPAGALAIQDARVLPVFESPSLSQANMLAMQNARILFVIDNVVLSQAYQLAVQNSLVALSMESPTLSFITFLAPDDVQISLSMESPLLVYDARLVIQNARILATFGNISLVQANVLQVQDARIVPVFESPAIQTVTQIARLVKLRGVLRAVTRGM